MGDLSQEPARVAKVHVDGLQRTRDDVVRRIVQRLFQVRTAEQLLTELQLPRSQLESLNGFRDVRVSVDTSKGDDAGEYDYEVTFRVKENSRLTGGINTVVGNRNDGSLLLHARAPNCFGRGESAHVEWQYGTGQCSGLNVGYTKPLCPWTRAAPKFSAIGYLSSSNLSWSGLGQQDRGLMLDLSARSSALTAHSLRLMNVWRQLDTRSPTVPMAVREHCRHDLKASVQHVFTYDSRDNGVLPRRGQLLKLVQEFAGLNGDVRFHKHELELQQNVSLLRRVCLQGSFTAGLLVPTAGDRPTSIADKFYLGGPLNVRGFRMFGIGPKKEDCVLGGSAFWAAGLHLYTPLPFDRWLGRFRESVRAHLFATGGRLDDLPAGGTLAESARGMFTEKLRLSAGLGVVLSLSNIARIELNYCVPLSAQAGDLKEGGLQFGIGMNYV